MQITSRTETDAGLEVKVKVEDESLYTFSGFSIYITDASLHRALKLCVTNERHRRSIKAERKEINADKRESKKIREERLKNDEQTIK